jgi:riboflavin synthase
MFTGIIEAMARVVRIQSDRDNVHFTLEAPLTPELKIDQSVAHNGVCLTVVAISGMEYTVTAIKETLQKTNLGRWAVGDAINLERSMQLGARLDGHMVQGHVDTTGTVVSKTEDGGSWRFVFQHAQATEWTTVPKGSICVNGVSLTVVDSTAGSFSVAVIPYTYEHTNFAHLQPGDQVNLEFDILGKYLARLLEQRGLS